MHPLRRLSAVVVAFIAAALTVKSSAGSPSAPLAYEIPAIRNGCHISTLAYLHRFRAEHPAERALEVRILRRAESGRAASHTIALFSWSGAWWCRDDVLGLAALDRPVAESGDLSALIQQAEDVLDRIEARACRRAARLRRGAGAIATSGGRFNRGVELERAAAVLPVPASRFELGEGRDRRIVLFYRPAPDRIAVYEPTSGSFVAETGARNDLAVVRAVARELGFDPATVRPADDVLAKAPRLADAR